MRFSRWVHWRLRGIQFSANRARRSFPWRGAADRLQAVNAVRPGHFKIWPLLVLGLVTCFYFRSPGVWAQPGAEDATFVPGFLQHGLVYAVALQTNGNIVVSGDFVIGLTRPRLARLQPSGALDRSFNIGDGANADVQAILVQPDQRILVAGAFTRFNRTDKLYLARLLPDGSVDASFAPDSFFSFVNALAVQPDGKILVGGARGLYRLLPDGKVDPAFAPTLRDFAVTVLALLPDGKILANGPSPDAHRLKRLIPDGSMDTNFVVEVSSVEALAVQPDSKLLVVGKFDSSATLVRRFLADGPPDPGFAPVTLRSSYAFPPTTLARTIFSLPDGKAIVAGEFYYVNDLTRGGIARLNADGSLDADFDTLRDDPEFMAALGKRSGV